MLSVENIEDFCKLILDIYANLEDIEWFLLCHLITKMLKIFYK